MARPRGRPKIVGKYTYYISYGNPGSLKTMTRNTPTEVRRALESIFNGQLEQARIYGTADEVAALTNLIMSFKDIPDAAYADRLRYAWSFQWGGQARVTLEAWVTRADYKPEEVKPDAQLL